MKNNRRMNRWCSLCLVVAMLLLIVPVAALAESASTEQGEMPAETTEINCNNTGDGQDEVPLNGNENGDGGNQNEELTNGNQNGDGGNQNEELTNGNQNGDGGSQNEELTNGNENGDGGSQNEELTNGNENGDSDPKPETGDLVIYSYDSAMALNGENLAVLKIYDDKGNALSFLNGRCCDGNTSGASTEVAVGFGTDYPVILKDVPFGTYTIRAVNAPENCLPADDTLFTHKASSGTAIALTYKNINHTEEGYSPSTTEEPADVTAVNYGNRYDHIDIKTVTNYRVTIDGKTTILDGTMQPNKIVVKVGNKTFDFSKYTVHTVTEGSKTEYEIRVNGLKASDIAYVDGKFTMTNVTVSGRVLFSSVPTEIQDVLELDQTTYGGKTYYFVDIVDERYTGVNECTGGNGPRSEGHTGTPTGLDLHIDAKAAEISITKGRLAIEKVLWNEDKSAEISGVEFSYQITDSSGRTLRFSDDGAYSESGSETVTVQSGGSLTLKDIPAGTYRITELQKDGYVIIDADGNPGTNYTVDFVITEKQDDKIPVVHFENKKLETQSPIRLRKTAEGVDDGYPNPTVSIYKAENGEKIGEALWTGTLTANGSYIYPTTYFEPNTTYIVVESGYEISGYGCEASVNGGASMLFTTGAAGELVGVTVHNKYVPAESAKVVISALKYLDGAVPSRNDFEFILKQKGTENSWTKNNNGQNVTFDALTFDAAGVYEYTLSEVQGSDSNIIYDGKTYGIKIKVVLNKDKNILEADVSVTLDDAFDLDEMRFDNTTKTGSLTITNTVSGKGGDKEKYFTFTLTLKYPNSNSVYATKGGSSKGTETFTLKDGQSKTVELPAGTEYTIAESDYDGYTVTVNGISADTATGVISANTKTEVLFNNFKAGPAVVQITAKKTLDGAAPTGSDFSFTLKDEKDEAVETVQNRGGDVTFSELTFNAEGTYRYTVREMIGTDGTIVYDDTVYSVVVIVEANADGDLVAEIVCSKGDEPVREMLFANETAETVSVQVSKVWVDGDSWRRPSAVTVQLYKDGVAFGDAVQLNKSNNWAYTWENLDAGSKWTVDEVNVPSGYVKKLKNKDNVWTVTNTLKDYTPGTSDNTHVLLWYILAAGSALSAAVMLVLRRKLRMCGS